MAFAITGGVMLASTALTVGAGLYEANQQQKLGREAIAAGNPFGPYRAQYAQKLNDLMANPNSITSDPGYQFGIDQANQGIARTMSGQIGSGNEQIALRQYDEQYAGNYLQQQESFLANLAGANMGSNPGPGLSEFNAGTNTLNSTLGSAGYLAQMYALMGNTGGSGGINAGSISPSNSGISGSYSLSGGAIGGGGTGPTGYTLTGLGQ